ncbi:MAG TPA: cell division protein ZapA [Candidatus Babeliales bacterium]|jgi:cell division protein ZapA (FtsZ GTPase activity inhibitor)|nr:cell division protein ZapA [Candidatus Babeliales bacterium]
MMNEKKSYKIQIFEEHYVLSSDESEALVAKAAEMVDASMKEISRHFAITDTKKIAILSALRLAGKLLHCQQEHDSDEERMVSLKNYIDQELSLLGL